MMSAAFFVGLTAMVTAKAAQPPPGATSGEMAATELLFGTPNPRETPPVRNFLRQVLFHFGNPTKSGPWRYRRHPTGTSSCRHPSLFHTVDPSLILRPQRDARQQHGATKGTTTGGDLGLCCGGEHGHRDARRHRAPTGQCGRHQHLAGGASCHPRLEHQTHHSSQGFHGAGGRHEQRAVW